MGIMAEPRYLIIHGHFYQPPRESPWTGIVAPELGAAPYANWNERILAECYAANLHARVNEGNVVHLCNNYESLDYNFGPTLLSWLERHEFTTYRAIIESDRAGKGGNAIAQAFNHSILPLLPSTERDLQIAWGLSDFRFRFRRDARAIWIPECAVDEETLKSVAATGVDFVILGSDQGRYSGPAAVGRGAGPFRFQRATRELAVFRFDRALSRELANRNRPVDGARLAAMIIEAMLEVEPGEALLLACDGEYFGHHRRGGADEIATALKIIREREGFVLTNCAAYLDSHPAQGSFESFAPSSWSCPHGIERWRSNCGCRYDDQTSQDWRAPLREAMEFVVNHAAAMYDRFAAAIVADPAAALRDSIILAIDRDEGARERLFARLNVTDEVRRDRLARLFEMRRAAGAVMTSCAWFFDDFAGPEGRIALKWAARTVELAAEVAPSIEPELIERLRPIRSNRREIADAASLYLSLKTREARGRV
jgi:hypothetical protein